MSNTPTTSLRIPEELLKRAKSLVPLVQSDPDPLFKYVTRKGLSFVLRLAIDVGLDKLEQAYNTSLREPKLPQTLGNTFVL